ncbi:MAG: hypothetical protein ACF8SC_05290, partial [Phycisphaerales bacterium JB037]
DIVLGGNPELLYLEQLRLKGIAADDPKAEEIKKEVYARAEAEKKEVLELGGLFVLGSERHEARRIDNQLRGRSGRQGDQGSSRFYVSLEDDLMKMFGGETMMKILPRLGLKEGDAIESRMLSNRIEGAQRKVEQRNFQIRKNILEYDEVMEHQRQRFYGTRQRVLEGRDVRGLIFDYIADSSQDAAGKYLDPGYPAECAAEFAKERTDTSILPDRLRGRDAKDIDAFIRREALSEARHNIDLTLGEYIQIEGSEVAVDFDSAGLVLWAKNRFGVEIDAADLRSGGEAERRQIFDMLCAAAEKKIEAADLEGLGVFFEKEYGARQLSEWTRTMFGEPVPVEEIVAAQQDEERDATDVVIEKAQTLYARREVQYPIDYAMELTMALMRQSPGQAAEHLANWANRRYQLGLDAEKIKTTPPTKVREMLSAAQERFLAENRLEAEIQAALATPDDAALEKHLQQRFNARLPERMRWLEAGERENAIRALIETIMRTEMLELEQTVLLETLDSSWKDHLYEMDQLRDSISFRAFSQQDPRIAFKKEGSQIFRGMMARVRDHVTEYIFKARISPAAMIQQAQARTQMQQRMTEMAKQQQRMQDDAASGPRVGVKPVNAEESDPPEGTPDAASAMESAQAAREQDRTKERKR